MERNIVLAHDLDVANIGGALILAPPTLPIILGGIGPLHGGADILDRGIEPDVEDLAFKTSAHLALVGDRNSPTEIASNAAIIQTLVKPLARDRSHKQRPVFL